MKVILTEDVKGRGQEGDVVEVAHGFAVNFLLPRKMAVKATVGNLKQLEARMHNIRMREESRRGEAETIASAINGKTVVIKAKAGEGVKLYGSVTSAMIGDAIADQLGVEIDRKKLDIHSHIKTLGEHPIAVHVYYDVQADVTVKVVALGEVEAPVAEPVAEVPAEVEEEAVAETVEEIAAEDAAPGLE